MRVSLSSMPSPPREYLVDFPRLDGGMNIWELDYRLERNESPDMKNLLWRDGTLSCRDGQVLVAPGNGNVGYSCYDRVFHGFAVFHVGGALYTAKVEVGSYDLETAELLTGVPENRGTWFRYGDKLYYKNRGGYFEISLGEDGSLVASPITAYDPVVLINTNPQTVAGDLYQPENRISPNKTVWYSTVEGVKDYRLPETDVEEVVRVEVDGAVLPDTEYTSDLISGVVTFNTAPTHHDPVRVNTVRITYRKRNPDAEKSIMDCCYAEVYGGRQSACVVLGGSEAQPNAYFWCGNHTIIDPGYFPFDQYNFAGGTNDMITGFGKQQSMLVIFSEGSIGRASLETVESSSGRLRLSMPYTSINSRIGCDLPWSIQLVENNLVFCNKSQGVHFIRDSSSALENNVEKISKKVDGSDIRPGLLDACRKAVSVVSFDDDNRYWVIADGEAYVWDYQISGYNNPSWFYCNNIKGVCYFRDGEDEYHVNSGGGISRFERSFSDYGQRIEKRYRFATQELGGFDYLKDVTSILISVRGDTDTRVQLTYESDYDVRVDPCPIVSFPWRLVPRNLSRRFLSVPGFSVVARRKPGCRHIRNFSLQLDNNEDGMDMSIVSAQIYYRYQGKER